MCRKVLQFFFLGWGLNRLMAFAFIPMGKDDLKQHKSLRLFKKNKHSGTLKYNSWQLAFAQFFQLVEEEQCQFGIHFWLTFVAFWSRLVARCEKTRFNLKKKMPSCGSGSAVVGCKVGLFKRCTEKEEISGERWELMSWILPETWHSAHLAAVLDRASWLQRASCLRPQAGVNEGWVLGRGDAGGEEGGRRGRRRRIGCWKQKNRGRRRRRSRRRARCWNWMPGRHVLAPAFPWRHGNSGE